MIKLPLNSYWYNAYFTVRITYYVADFMKREISIQTIDEASKKLQSIVKHTPLEYQKRLSDRYHTTIYVKREDQQVVRSYKIRGAYNLMQSLTPDEKNRGVVCASAGNHAQGVAMSADLLHIKATIYMPETTPLQKINKVKHFGKKWITIKLFGKSYDESCKKAQEFAKHTQSVFVHPFDDERTINGQGTVGKEIYDDLGNAIDVVIVPIGGGGLISGVGTYLKEKKESITIVGAEPKGAPSMYNAIKNHKVVTVEHIDTFVDGAAVKTAGEKTYTITSHIVNDIILVPEGKVCETMIELYQHEGIITEPAGALSIAALDYLTDVIRNKTVVCILSGGNNDIMRYPEILERSLTYQGLKHYFLIEFAQRPGQLRYFLDNALGPTDDIVRFEYIKKNSKEKGTALVGIEVQQKNDLEKLLAKMDHLGIRYIELTEQDLLYTYLI